ncbi:MAG: Tim44 domain-containing protein [candidate division NC10 bacterium]|nr:Tim44 domain-containing protein [candidate division NC10 bacterium]
MRHDRFLSFLAVVLGVTVVVLTIPDDVLARAGGGGSFGSRGTRTFSRPSRTYSAPSPLTAPKPQPSGPQATPTPTQQPAPSPMGGLWRTMAGGVLGGMLGGLLFSSFGHAGGFGAGGGWGFGLMDLLLLGGIAYLVFWMFRRNRAREAPVSGYYEGAAAEPYARTEAAAVSTLEPAATAAAEDRVRGIGHIRQMDPGFNEPSFTEWCTDTFFRIQAAWMRREIEGLRSVLTEEMAASFREQMEAAQARGQVNRLENITVRSVEITEAWQERGQDYVTVRFLANLLDYTVEEVSGKVVAGSVAEPMKFEEYWTWVRPVGPNPWRLSAIHQPA